jgi:predicted  nucleic acid-binding Zn-ribbon protein
MTLMEQILQLHGVDVQVRALQGRLDTANHYLQTQERLLKDVKDQHDEVEMQRKHTQAQVANLEMEAAGVAAQIQKMREELNNSGNSKQYSTILTALKALELQKDNFEQLALGQMEKVEQLGARLNQFKTQLAERTSLRDKAAAEVRERTDESAARLGELKKERAAAAAHVPAEAMKLFDVVADMHDGEAVAPVTAVDPRAREYACSACNVEIPYQVYSRLLGAGTSLVQCLSCKRILYLEQTEIDAAAKKRRPAAKNA